MKFPEFPMFSLSDNSCPLRKNWPKIFCNWVDKKIVKHCKNWRNQIYFRARHEWNHNSFHEVVFTKKMQSIEKLRIFNIAYRFFLLLFIWIFTKYVLKCIFEWWRIDKITWHFLLIESNFFFKLFIRTLKHGLHKYVKRNRVWIFV